MENGIPTCPNCGGHWFSVGCAEVISYRIDFGQEGGERWDETHDHVDNYGEQPYLDLICLNRPCEQWCSVTPEAEKAVREVLE